MGKRRALTGAFGLPGAGFQRWTWRSWFAVVGVWLSLGATPVAAHPLEFTETTLRLRSDGTFQVDMIVDLDALALGAPQDADDAELVAALTALSPPDRETLVERLARLFERRVRVRFDDEPTPFDVTFPDRGTPAATEAEIPTILGLTARLDGVIPAGAVNVSFFASRAFSDIHLTVVDEARDMTVRSVLERGGRSDPLELAGPATEVTAASTAAQYVRLGFRHIIPEGLDHVLFVLGLFLFARQLRPLVWQVTAFTVAHAVTLALGASGIISLSAALVEPLIALSIAWVAVENILRPADQFSHTTGGRWRLVVVFGFGLLHGLGFAQVLQELGPENESLVALAAFNVGIELGQLAVVAGSLLTVGWFRDRAWYRPWIVVPASAAIALVGLYWSVERALS